MFVNQHLRANPSQLCSSSLSVKEIAPAFVSNWAEMNGRCSLIICWLDWSDCRHHAAVLRHIVTDKLQSARSDNVVPSSMTAARSRNNVIKGQL